MINLKPVTEETFRKVVDMKLPPEQNCYVAPNVVSLAQAWLYYDETRPFAVLDENEVVGFLMLDWDENERTVGVWRFMIAPEHQKKGYGRKTMEAMIQMVREEDKFDLIHLDYVKGNLVARDLYYSLGFRETGEEEDGEVIMTLPLTDAPKVGMTTADEEDLDELLELLADEKQGSTTASKLQETGSRSSNQIPTLFTDEAAVKELVAKRQVKRFTLYGKAIGLAAEKIVFIQTKNLHYLPEAEIKYRNNQDIA